MKQEKFPHVSPELVKALAEMFPNRCPDLATPDREVWHKAGAASVVSFLRHKSEDQNKTFIEDD